MVVDLRGGGGDGGATAPVCGLEGSSFVDAGFAKGALEPALEVNSRLDPLLLPSDALLVETSWGVEVDPGEDCDTILSLALASGASVLIADEAFCKGGGEARVLVPPIDTALVLAAAS